MKIYGVGVLKAPGTSRVVHDFSDGPFDTSNPVLLAEAKKRGFSVGRPLSLSDGKPVEESNAPKVVRVKRKYVRKQKDE